jgi:omega-6 fatty acid desaturase (delta-12 desaturase)
LRRFLYAAFYSKLVFFTIAPYLLFVWAQRLFATVLENTLQAAYLYALYQHGGLSSLAFDQSTALILASAGFLFSHIEHTFDGAYRRHESESERKGWDKYESGMLGSSILVVPWGWGWMTAGLEFHHIHHTNTRVPVSER